MVVTGWLLVTDYCLNTYISFSFFSSTDRKFSCSLEFIIIKIFKFNVNIILSGEVVVVAAEVVMVEVAVVMEVEAEGHQQGEPTTVSL